MTTQEIRHNPFKETGKDEQKVYTEGTPNQVLVTKYERNPFARKTFASVKLRDDWEVVMTAFESNKNSIIHASKRLQQKIARKR